MAKRSIRLSDAGDAKIDAWVETIPGADWSKAVRALLTEAFADANVERRARQRLIKQGEIL